MTELEQIAMAVGGPYFDDLYVGQTFDTAPAMTLTSGAAALHQAILGDRLRLPLDAGLSRAVTGTSAMAHPALVCDVAIGQSTLATQRVMANLFYRGLWFHRFPVIGDTLHTTTEVVALKQNSARPGRTRSGLAALRVLTVDQDGMPVLDFHRCAMLPLHADAPDTDHADDLSVVGCSVRPAIDPTQYWDADAFHARVKGPAFTTELQGTTYRSTGDVVSNAPELARLTLNIAAVHHDSTISSNRLVYGGHTIGLAFAQATRALGNLVTVLGWESCDHTGPVHEGDTLSSELRVLSAAPLPDGRGGLLRLQSLMFAGDRQVLDWTFIALHF